MATLIIVPLQAVPAQTMVTMLNGQSVRLNVYQRTTGLFVDVGINDALVIAGVIALDRNWIVRDLYRGLIGDLAFWDSMGTEDPIYTGLQSRYFLGYWP